MNLGELIYVLRSVDPEKVVANGFKNPHSYRGIYADVAFEPATDVTVGSMLEAAENALQWTFTAWKGGEYTYDENDDVWIAVEGCCADDPFTLLHLQQMLGQLSDSTHHWPSIARSLAVELYRQKLLSRLDSDTESAVLEALETALAHNRRTPVGPDRGKTEVSR